MEIPCLRVFPTENIPCSKTDARIPRVCEYHQGWKAEKLLETERTRLICYLIIILGKGITVQAPSYKTHME